MLSYSDTASARQVEGLGGAPRPVRRRLPRRARPPAARIGDVKVDTSVRKRRDHLRRRAGRTWRPTRAYALRAAITDGGRTVAEFTSQPFSGERPRRTAASRFTDDVAAREALGHPHAGEHVSTCASRSCDADGKVLDAALPVRFGFREFWIDGRDFYLNGTRIFLSAVPLDNAQVGAALATYEAARESLQRLKSFGINFVYTHNYGCEPGSHLSFAEILRAADDVGHARRLLAAALRPLRLAGARRRRRPTATPRHAEFYVRVAAEPSVGRDLLDEPQRHRLQRGHEPAT